MAMRNTYITRMAERSDENFFGGSVQLETVRLELMINFDSTVLAMNWISDTEQVDGRQSPILG